MFYSQLMSMTSITLLTLSILFVTTTSYTIGVGSRRALPFLSSLKSTADKTYALEDYTLSNPLEPCSDFVLVEVEKEKEQTDGGIIVSVANEFPQLVDQ